MPHNRIPLILTSFIMRMLIAFAFAATVPGVLVVYSQSSKPSEKNSTSKTVRATQQVPGQPAEEFSFLIKDFNMDHQAQANNLNISISYRYDVGISKSEYPDFRWLAKDVETFLTTYPNEDDYSEILNKQISELLLKKYPVLRIVVSEVKIDPSNLVPYTRSSRVTRERPVSGSKR